MLCKRQTHRTLRTQRIISDDAGNSEMKSGVSELVMTLNLVLLAFMQVRGIPFLGKEIMAFPQSIIELWAVR